MIQNLIFGVYQLISDILVESQSQQKLAQHYKTQLI